LTKLESSQGMQTSTKAGQRHRPTMHLVFNRLVGNSLDETRT